MEPEVDPGGDGAVSGAARRRREAWLAAAGLILLGVAAHGAALRADFYMDDMLHITANPHVLSGRWWEAEFRQMPTLIFSLFHGAFGPVPWIFHALNLLLHVATTLALWWTGRWAWRTAVVGRLGRWAAWAGAAVFACHPALSEGVNYAQNASLQMVTFFSVLAVGSMCRFGRRGEWQWLALAAVLVAFATFSKEVGAVYSGSACLLALLLPGGHRAGEKLTRLRQRRPLLTLALLVTAGTGLAVVGWQAGRWALSSLQNPLWLSHCFTQGLLFWRYLGLLLWPSGLCVDHHVPLSGTWDDPASMAGTLGVGLLLLGLLVALGQRRSRTAAVLGLLGLTPLLARFIHINKEFFVEYRLYPAAPWLALLMGWCLAWLLLHRRRLGLPLALALALAAIFASRSRSAVWEDRETLAADAIRQYPLNMRARTQWQGAAYARGDWQEVARLAAECRGALVTIEQFNAARPQGRRYELSFPYRALACSEHFMALMLAETRTCELGVAHLDRVMDGLNAISPSFLDERLPDYEIGGQLVSARRLLEAHGPAYERLRQSGAAPVPRLLDFAAAASL